MNWDQPICDECFFSRFSRVPVRIRGDYREKEQCCYCGRENLSGIYIRADPLKVPFPKKIGSWIQ